MANEKNNTIKLSPVSCKEACVCGDKYRFTVLTSRLIRIEYSETGAFEDRATQTVVNRNFPPVSFTIKNDNGILTIKTDDVLLTYTGQPFSKNSLSARYCGKNSKIDKVWYFGDEKSDYSFPGTTRTLDGVDGSCPLEKSIMSNGPINMLDDSSALIIAENGDILPRSEKCIDIYLFCYGVSDKRKYDYLGCLRDFYALTGKTPLLPRYILGNWWSRYHAYTQKEYEDLMLRFKREDIPFSVAVIDMDWHYVNIDPKYGRGWTGYTWDKGLFPDHKAFLKFLHKEGLGVTLNLHPADGVSAHEEAYPEMAKSMGIDPKSEERVEFDITNKRFLKNYFDILHHPLEDEGVDFWWMDWQQGNTTHIPGLDPLWMLNHYHYIDSDRNNKRPLIFSRYSGPGSHRYPIGFSGDTFISWESLDFQAYFTAAASNIGYGWWSHDIGGHMAGVRDEELTCRWIQYGVFSPINRLHSTSSRFLGKEPWKYEKQYETAMKSFLKLRHELIPYLYSMNYRANVYDEPLVMPLYYKWSGDECYRYKNEYSFGTEMIVSPITAPCDSVTHLGCADTYIPEGYWYDFFTNIRYSGGRTLKLYRNIYSIPVLVKAGGIIPLAKLTHINDTENPQNMKIKVYAGASNSFELYEDDGISNDYKNGSSAITRLSLDWGKNALFTISQPTGAYSPVSNRGYEVEFIGINAYDEISVTADNKPVKFTSDSCNAAIKISIENTFGEVRIELTNPNTKNVNSIVEIFEDIIEHASVKTLYKDRLFNFLTDDGIAASKKLSELLTSNLDENIKNALAEIVAAEI